MKLKDIRNRSSRRSSRFQACAGNTGAGVEGVKKSVEQAVGSDILFSNNKIRNGG